MSFGMKLSLLVIGLVILMVATTSILEKIFKVEKMTWFSYNHVNERHKKIDWTIRISVMVLIFIQSAFNIKNDFQNSPWYLQTYIILILSMMLSDSVRVIFEKKYAENKKQYLVTVCQLLFGCILAGVLFSTLYLGWVG